MKTLYLILFLTLILFGCTFYPREVHTEFGDYTKPKIEATATKANEVSKMSEKSTGKASWYEITGYCLNQQPMASGKKVYDGAIACPAFLKLGTKVQIKGREYVCEDRMHRRYRNGNYIDIWFEDCAEALKWGRRKQEVITATKGSR